MTSNIKRAIISKLIVSPHYEAIGTSANEVNPDLYDCVNQRRVRALLKLNRDVLERKCLTEILAQLSSYQSILDHSTDRARLRA